MKKSVFYFLTLIAIILYILLRYLLFKPLWLNDVLLYLSISLVALVVILLIKYKIAKVFVFVLFMCIINMINKYTFPLYSLVEDVSGGPSVVLNESDDYLLGPNVEVNIFIKSFKNENNFVFKKYALYKNGGKAFPSQSKNNRLNIYKYYYYIDGKDTTHIKYSISNLKYYYLEKNERPALPQNTIDNKMR